MSKLESEVRPSLEPMILCGPATLDMRHQLTVATWAAMKVMVFEYVWGREPISTDADRALVMAESRPPANAQIRLAALESEGRPLQELHRVYVRGNPPPRDPAREDLALCVTLVIGCVVIQVLAGPAADDQKFERVGVPTDTYIPTFPPSPGTVQWPPLTSLTDATLDNFAHPLGTGYLHG
jgi:hypothetical protein